MDETRQHLAEHPETQAVPKQNNEFVQEADGTLTRIYTIRHNSPEEEAKREKKDIKKERAGKDGSSSRRFWFSLFSSTTWSGRPVFWWPAAWSRIRRL